MPRKLYLAVFASLFLLAGATIDVNAQKLTTKAKAAEKRWAVAHPFIAPGSFRTTKAALKIVHACRGHFGLDTALSEGTYDAFRHGYWMASLAQRYKSSKVRALGDAHERSNYIAFLKKEKEHGIIPDSANAVMDQWNNLRGIEIGKAHPKASADSLRILVLEEIRKGNFRVIRRDAYGRYLDSNDQPIPPEKLKGTWMNPKCLSPSKLY
jgi:hypothetical protein